MVRHTCSEDTVCPLIQWREGGGTCRAVRDYRHSADSAAPRERRPSNNGQSFFIVLTKHYAQSEQLTPNHFFDFGYGGLGFFSLPGVLLRLPRSAILCLVARWVACLGLRLGLPDAGGR